MALFCEGLPWQYVRHSGVGVHESEAQKQLLALKLLPYQIKADTSWRQPCWGTTASHVSTEQQAARCIHCCGDSEYECNFDLDHWHLTTGSLSINRRPVFSLQKEVVGGVLVLTLAERGLIILTIILVCSIALWKGTHSVNNASRPKGCGDNWKRYPRRNSGIQCPFMGWMGCGFVVLL